MASDRRSYKERFKHGARFTLCGIRLGMKMTQPELAEAMGSSQTMVSRIERESLDVREVQTLRPLIEAMGCRLELVVVAPNGARFILVDPHAVTQRRTAAEAKART